MDMVMGWIFAGLVGISLVTALLTGNGSQLAAAVVEGGQGGVNLAISMAGSLCLWSGVGAVMEKTGVMGKMSKLLTPVLSRIFPSYSGDPAFAGPLCANVCANLLGLGNAATPMGIQAARRLAQRSPGVASDELCRLIVLNTASIQLIPANVAAIRWALGCSTPFDMLPAVWVTSLCSAALGLLAAWSLGKLWRR